MTRQRVYSGAFIKKLDCGKIFKAANSFPRGELPTNRQVIKRMLIFPNYTARKVAHKLHDIWIWCNAYPQYHYTIATKIQETMTTFSKVTRYPKKEHRVMQENGIFIPTEHR